MFDVMFDSTTGGLELHKMFSKLRILIVLVDIDSRSTRACIDESSNIVTSDIKIKVLYRGFSLGVECVEPRSRSFDLLKV